jgi:O-antigen ligase
LITVTKLNLNIWKSSLIAILLSTIVCAILYKISPHFQARLDLASHEILTYPWHGGMAPDTSVGLRITFQRLGWFYFSQSPIFGWGANGYTTIKDASEVLSFSSQYARDFVSTALFHNELMTNMVRHGFFGIAAYVFAVLIPFLLALKGIMSNNPIVKRAALLCSCFLICQIIAGFSDEFLNLKGMVAFYAYLISILLGTMISYSRIYISSEMN